MRILINFFTFRNTAADMKNVSRLLLITLLFMVQCSTSYAELDTIMTFGIGQGTSNTQGDYTGSLSGNVFRMGIDYDIQNGLFLTNGLSSTKNDFKQMDLIVGLGTKNIKLGTGFIGIQTSLPTNPHYLFDTSGTFATDNNKRIDLSVTTIPLYLRFKPYTSRNLNLVVDGYYGLYSRGSMTFPLFETGSGQYATVSSVPKEQGGAKGYSVALIWRLPHKMSAIKLEYQHREATMVKKTSGIETDVFGLYGTVTTPEMTFQNSALLLNYVLAK